MGRKQGPRLVLSFPPEFDAALYRSRYADLADLRRSQLKEHWRQEGRRARRNAAPVDNRDDLLRCLQPAGHLLEIGPFDKGNIAAFGNQQGVLAGLGEFAPTLLHLGRSRDVEISRVKAKAFRIVHGGARADTQQHIMCRCILSVHIMRIIRRNEG
jgi:hypothetical protein